MIINYAIQNSSCKDYISEDNAIAAAERVLGKCDREGDYDIIVMAKGKRFTPVIRWHVDAQQRILDSAQAGFYSIV